VGTLKPSTVIEPIVLNLHGSSVRLGSGSAANRA
jgi:hypothetical protein